MDILEFTEIEFAIEKRTFNCFEKTMSIKSKTLMQYLCSAIMLHSFKKILHFLVSTEFIHY